MMFGGLFIIIIIILLMNNQNSHDDYRKHEKKTPLDILDEQYALGELSDDEYRQKKRNLN